MASRSNQGSFDRRSVLLSGTALVAATLSSDALAQAQQLRPRRRRLLPGSRVAGRTSSSS